MRLAWIRHVMLQIRYFYPSKLFLILSKGGASSVVLNPLGFYVWKLKLHEIKLNLLRKSYALHWPTGL